MASDRKEKLQDLFDALVNALLTEVKAGGDKNAQVLSVARQFLKDNNIDAVVAPGTPLHSLATALPFSGDDDAPMRLVK